MGVHKIGQILTNIDGAIHQMASLRSATYAAIKMLRVELEEAAQDPRAGYSTKVQIDSLISEIDRAMDDDHRLGLLIDYLVRTETRLKANLSLTERADAISFLEAIEDEWKLFKERHHEREHYTISSTSWRALSFR